MAYPLPVDDDIAIKIGQLVEERDTAIRMLDQVKAVNDDLKRDNAELSRQVTVLRRRLAQVGYPVSEEAR